MCMSILTYKGYMSTAPALLRGTRILQGLQAQTLRNTIDLLVYEAKREGFEEIVLPSLWEQSTFENKAGPEILEQMYTFQDKGGRPACLLPEGTAPIVELYKSQWEQTRKKPVKVFYVQRFYRYERPQAGRYREFWQFGVEILGPKPEQYVDYLIRIAEVSLSLLNFDQSDYKIHTNVTRGLSYYTEQANCFEIEMPCLGAQKQILGGGQYDCGIGFAFGLDRLLLAKEFLKC